MGKKRVRYDERGTIGGDEEEEVRRWRVGNRDYGTHSSLAFFSCLRSFTTTTTTGKMEALEYDDTAVEEGGGYIHFSPGYHGAIMRRCGGSFVGSFRYPPVRRSVWVERVSFQEIYESASKTSPILVIVSLIVSRPAVPHSAATLLTYSPFLTPQSVERHLNLSKMRRLRGYSRRDEKAPSHPFLKTAKVHSHRRHSSPLLQVGIERNRDLDLSGDRVRSSFSPGEKRDFLSIFRLHISR